MDEVKPQPLDSKVLEQLIAESDRIEEDAKHSAKSHFECADGWGYRNMWIGIPTTIAAAIAGVAALKNYPLVAGIMSLAVAASSAVFTFLNPKERSGSHLAAGNNYKCLQNDTRMFRCIDCVQRATDLKLIDDLKALNDRRNKLNAESPQFSRKAFNRAREGINQGEATYAVDKGANPPA